MFSPPKQWYKKNQRSGIEKIMGKEIFTQTLANIITIEMVQYDPSLDEKVDTSTV